MAYTVHQAKTHFSRLLKEAEAGREVVVMRGKKPVARIVAISETAADKSDTPFRLMGAYRGRIAWSEDAFAPMSDHELEQCGLGYMLGAPLVPQPPEQPKK